MSVAVLSRSRASISTPGLLQLAMAALAALAILAAAASLWAAVGITDAARTIGRDAEPSVALGLHMAATLGDLDAAAMADALVEGGATYGTSRQFQEGMATLSSDLVEAGRNITYGEAEAEPLRRLQRLLLLYQEFVAEARYVGAGNAWVTAQRVEWASRLNHDFVAPQAVALAAANADELERRYAAYRANSGIGAALGMGTISDLLAALIAAQVWLTRRTRRVVNPLLALATMVTAACLFWFAAADLGEREDLRAAKNDAYDSLHVLFEARADVNAIRTDMSEWLLDPTARLGAQDRIVAAIQALIGPDIDVGRPASTQALMAALQDALKLEIDLQPQLALTSAPHLSGLLGEELANVTYGVPERQGATDSIVRLLEAEAIAHDIRNREKWRDHDGAVRRWLDPADGGGVGAFAAVQDAIDRTIAINQTEFDKHVAAALRTAALMPFVTCGGMALAALLAVLGLWLRLREYR